MKDRKRKKRGPNGHPPPTQHNPLGNSRRPRWRSAGGLTVCTASVLGVLVLMSAYYYRSRPPGSERPPPRSPVDATLGRAGDDTPSSDNRTAATGDLATAEESPAERSPESAGPVDVPSPETAEALRREVYALAEKAVLDFPHATGPLVLMARLHHQFGDRAESVVWWRKALQRSLEGPSADMPMAAAATTRMGVIAADGGDYEKALELFRKARQMDPAQRGLHQRLGHALLQLGKPEEAIESLKEELRRRPQSKTPYRTLGQAFLESEQFENAVASFEKAIALEPNDSQAYYGLTVACTRLGQMDKAQKYGDTFRQLRAANDETLQSERSNFSDTDWMRRAVAPLHRHAGEIYLAQGRPRDGEQHLKRAAELDPNDRQCRQRLIDIYMRQRRYAEALPLCQELRQLEPHVANYQLNAGVVLASLKQYAEAEEALRTGVQLAPDRPDGYDSLVQVLLLGTRKFSDAQAMARKLVELQPTAIHYYMLSVASEANHDTPAAWAAIERASKLAPDDDRIRRTRERLRRSAREQKSEAKGARGAGARVGRGGSTLWCEDARGPDDECGAPHVLFCVLLLPCLVVRLFTRAPPHRRSRSRLFFAAGLALLCATTIAQEPCPIVLRDVTSSTGIGFRHTHGGSGRLYVFEPMSAGLALLDYDGDEDVDIYFLNGAPLPGTKVDSPPTNALYRNDGDFHFTDVTQSAGVGDRGYGLGVAAADYDNDGDQDLYLNNYGPNVLYRNNGDGTFTDVTDQSGVANDHHVGAGANFLDIDGDGALDLFVSSYVQFSYDTHRVLRFAGQPVYAGPRDYPPTGDHLYRNTGDGRFIDVSEGSGIGRHRGTGMGTVCADYDNDGDTDIYVANDDRPNFLFQNDGKGRFVEVGLIAGVAYDLDGGEQSSMGVGCGDYDNDGWLDFYVTGYQQEWALLYRNLGHGLFEDVTRRSGAGMGTFPHVNWGAEFVDFDNDGDRDLFIACGHFERGVERFDDSTALRVRNLLLMNTGHGKFVNVSDRAGDGLTVASTSRGAAFDDLDGDGDLDVVIMNWQQAPTVLRNDSDTGNHWIQVQLRGVRSNRDGVGARVRVTAGDLTQIDEVHSGRGYQSHYGTRLHFGLGKRDKVDRIEVQWVGAGADVLENVPVDRRVTVTEGRGR